MTVRNYYGYGWFYFLFFFFFAKESKPQGKKDHDVVSLLEAVICAF